MVGYYNGAEIGLLDDGGVPRAQNDSGAELQQVATRLQSNRILSQLATLECRDSQLTIQPRSGSKFPILWEVAQQILSEIQASNCRFEGARGGMYVESKLKFHSSVKQILEGAQSVPEMERLASAITQRIRL
jgi:hypothetical protein